MAKVDKLIEKYKGRITSRTINALNKGDETATKKYLEYMCKLWLDVRSAPKVVKLVKEFDELLPYIQNKDIYHSDYSNSTKLLDTIAIAQEIREEKTFVKEEHVEVLIDNDDYIMLIPKTHRGSLKYGKGTKWCTAETDYSGHFESYSRGGYLIYLLRKNEKGDIWDKVAFYVERGDASLGGMQVFSSNDSEKSSRDFYKSTWSFEDIMFITTYIRQYSSYFDYKSIAKEYITNVKETLSKIDIIKLIHFKNILSDDTDTFSDIDERLKEINEKLNKINV